MERRTRSMVPEQETWDLTDLFESEITFEAELVSLEDDVHTVLEYKSKLGRDKETLLGAIKTLEAFEERMIQVGTYAMLCISADGSDAENQALYAKTFSILTKIEAKLAFFVPEILTIPEETITAFIKNDPGLTGYKKNATGNTGQETIYAFGRA